MSNTAGALNAEDRPRFVNEVRSTSLHCTCESARPSQEGCTRRLLQLEVQRLEDIHSTGILRVSVQVSTLCMTSKHFNWNIACTSKKLQPKTLHFDVRRSLSMNHNYTILLFSHLRSLVGSDTVLVEHSGRLDVGMLKERLASLYPVLAHEAYAIAVGRRIVTDEQVLEPDDEIAVLPPFSGG